jgi:hypothetical protein
LLQERLQGFIEIEFALVRPKTVAIPFHVDERIEFDSGPRKHLEKANAFDDKCGLREDALTQMLVLDVFDEAALVLLEEMIEREDREAESFAQMLAQSGLSRAVCSVDADPPGTLEPFDGSFDGLNLAHE